MTVFAEIGIEHMRGMSDTVWIEKGSTPSQDRMILRMNSSNSEMKIAADPYGNMSGIVIGDV